MTEPTYDELYAWWEHEGMPPYTDTLIVEYQAAIVDFLKEVVPVAWQAGDPAPYDLYDHDGRLVEAVGGNATPIIVRGDPIPEPLAARVATAVNPPKPAPIPIDTVTDATSGPIDEATFIGVWVDPEGQCWAFEAPPEPQLLTWVEVA